MSTGTSTSADHIPGLMRVENTGPEEMINECLATTRPAYPHEQVYGRYCTIEEYVDCPPEKTRAFKWMWIVRPLYQPG